MVNFETRIGDLRYKFPVSNASGVWCTREDELIEIAKSGAGAVVFKSMTLEPRQGNPEPRFFAGPNFSINSMGLPNLGVDYYCDVVGKMQHYRKPLVASIAGFSAEDFEELCRKVDKYPFHGIEVNLSCPNLVGKGIFAYDIPHALSIVRTLRGTTNKTLGVKLPPYNERAQVQQMAEGLLEAGIEFVTTMNSVPIGLDIDIESETKVIRPNGGMGGLGGPEILHSALGQVRLFYELTEGKIGIIGVGGVKSAEDVYKFILAGASSIQVGTVLAKRGPALFSEIKRDLTTLLNQKGVNDLQDKIGSVQAL